MNGTGGCTVPGVGPQPSTGKRARTLELRRRRTYFHTVAATRQHERAQREGPATEHRETFPAVFAGPSYIWGRIMPARAKRPCTEPGCPTLVRGGRCDPHRRKRERARGTRQERGYDRHHERWRRQVLERDRHVCQPCLRAKRINTENIQADHIVPFDQGGERLDPGNGQAICSRCHGFKTAWERTHGPNEPWPETEAGWS